MKTESSIGVYFKRSLLVTLCTVVAPKKETEKAILLDCNSDQVFPQLRNLPATPQLSEESHVCEPRPCIGCHFSPPNLPVPFSSFLSLQHHRYLLPPHLILSLCLSPPLSRWLARANIAFKSLFKITFMRVIVWLAFVIFNPLP